MSRQMVKRVEIDVRVLCAGQQVVLGADHVPQHIVVELPIGGRGGDRRGHGVGGIKSVISVQVWLWLLLLLLLLLLGRIRQKIHGRRRAVMVSVGDGGQSRETGMGPV